MAWPFKKVKVNFEIDNKARLRVNDINCVFSPLPEPLAKVHSLFFSFLHFDNLLCKTYALN